MKRRVHTIWAILTSLMIALSGCRPQQPFYLHEDGDLSHYLHVATDIDYPDVEAATLAEVTEARAPFTLENFDFDNYWDLTLEEAIHAALCNSKVFRSLGGRFVTSAFNNRTQTGEAPDAITQQTDAVRTIYDPAIIETTPFTGVENALAAFDAQWANNFFYQHNDRQQNILPQGVITDFFRQVFQQNTSTFNTQLTKVTATGAQFSVRNNIVYDLNNNPTRQVAKDWNVNYEFAFNQPLLQGAGVEYNRIAGPNNPFVQVPGAAPQSPGFDGVILARINVDISLADFEGGVRDLVNDTEQAYWELSFAWRNLETANTALNSARQTWQKIHVLFTVGGRGGEAKEEAQAREQFYQFKSQAQTLLNELFRAENRLRYIMGLAATDGRLIRPIDRPSIAKVDFDWCEITEEALARNLNIRRQKWRIKEAEMQLIAAKNQLLPRLDINGTYRWLGLGDNLFGRRDFEFTPSDPFALTGSSALQTLASGQFQEWQLGLQSTFTIGLRRELATVRHFQLQLARARARLQDLELEISHQLSDAERQLILNYELTQTNFNRTLAADRQVDAVQAAFDAATVTLDQLLEAQRRRAEAQASFFRTLLDYQRAIITLHFRKGSLLEYNNVYLAEGPWPDKAQFDAHRLARQRDAGVYLNYGFTRPSVVSQGAIRQNPEGMPPALDAPGLLHEGGIPADGPLPEELPAPEADEPLPAPDSYGRAAPRRGAPGIETQAASALVRHFEWGPLGLKSDDDRAQDDTWSRIVGESGGERPTRSAVKQTHSTVGDSDARPASATTTPSSRDDSVRRIHHHEPQPASAAPQREPVSRAASGSTARIVAGGQGS
jgi:outer membrane protein TolC